MHNYEFSFRDIFHSFIVPIAYEISFIKANFLMDIIFANENCFLVSYYKESSLSLTLKLKKTFVWIFGIIIIIIREKELATSELKSAASNDKNVCSG